MQQNKDFDLRQFAENALKNSVVRLNVKRKIPLLSLRPQYDLSIKLNSEKPRYFFDRGLSKASLEQYQDAEIDFMKARQLQPDIEKKSKDE